MIRIAGAGRGFGRFQGRVCACGDRSDRSTAFGACKVALAGSAALGDRRIASIVQLLVERVSGLSPRRDLSQNLRSMPVGRRRVIIGSGHIR